MRIFISMILTLSLSLVVHAETPGPRTQTFAKADETLVRHSEGTAVELSDGRIFLIWQEFRKGTKGDSDFYPARLVAKTSNDEGKTWSHYRSIVEIAPGDLNVFSPSLLRLADGSILLAFLRKHDYEKPGDYYTPTSAFVLISRDEAETFEPLGTIWSNGHQHLCNNTLKQISTGRIIIPTDRDYSTKENPDNWACGCVYSDDGGKTWTFSENFATLPKRGGMEPHIEELSDGRLL
ncbi:MAG: sialidase family protein, partial [Planctomycetota bacterium]|nr:sialidase family protein [Planctomycetota bacterium]